MIVETNERIDKSLEPEIVDTLLKILSSYGVPMDKRTKWIHVQRHLISQLRQYYRQQRKEAASNDR